MKTKILVKVGMLFCVCTALMSVLCVSALAADYTTKTEYVGTSADSKIVVTATAANVAEGDYVTYVAYNGDEADENSIVHINQDVSDKENGGTISFKYTTTLENVSSTKLFGGTVSGSASAVQTPVKENMYAAKLVIGGVESGTVYFDKYEENTTPYIVARKFSLGDYTGAVADVQIDGASVDFVVNEGTVTVYTDKIASNDCVINVLTTLPYKTSISLGLGSASDDGSFVVNCKTDLNTGSEYGILVSKNGDFGNIVAYEQLSDSFTWEEDSTIAFPALGKNENGVFAIQFEEFESGTYHFAAYVIEPAKNGYVMDTKDINGETVSYTFE